MSVRDMLDEKHRLTKLMNYRESPDKGRFQWETTDGQAFDLFLDAYHHQKDLGV